MENNQEGSKFVTNVNINAPIHNYYAHVEKMYTGSQPKSDSMKELKDQVTDERISRAIISINGDNKPLNEKQLFIGVICVLMSKYGWSGKFLTCCTRINNLPMRDMFEKECDYNSIKVLTAYKFASVDYKDWETYEPSNSERGIFRKCKVTADAFDKAILMQEE